MQEHTQDQAAEQHALIVGDSEVQTDVLQEKEQRVRPVVKVGHQLEF